MATFKHDSQGFLIGELVESNRDLHRLTQQGVGIWKSIRTDVKTIARGVNVEVATTSRSSRTSGAYGPASVPMRPTVSTSRVSRGSSMAGSYVGPTATPRARGAHGRFVAGTSQPTAVSPSTAIAASSALERRANGQFGAGQTRRGGGDGPAGATLGRAMNRLSASVGKMSAGMHAVDNIDPTVTSMKEVSDVVSPIGRGLFSIFGRSAERKKERWYARILKALTPSGPKKDGAQGGGWFGMGGGASAAGAGIGAGLGSLLGAMLGKGKGLLKVLGRLPVLGALLAGGGALASLLGGGTREEKYKGVGEAGGMFAGGLAGAKAGAMLGALLGPIGASVGAVVGGLTGALLGEVVGAKVGDWTRQLMDADIGGQIVGMWQGVTAGIGAAWQSLAADARTAWDQIAATAGEWWGATRDAAGKISDQVSSIADGMNDWIKEKTGVDVKEKLQAGWDKTKEVAGAALTGAKDMAGAAVDRARETLSKGGELLVSAASSAIPNTVKRAANAGVEAGAQAKAGYDTARGSEPKARAPETPLQEAARHAGASLGNLIAKGEGDYGSFNRGVAGDAKGAKMNFANMTIDEVMAAQSLPKGDANRLFAVGKYQVIPSTMKGAATTMGLSGSEKLTPELQERIFSEYLIGQKRPQIDSFIRGEHDNLNSAVSAGAREWASIADPKTGKSFYAGTGNNKASLSAEVFGSSLTGARDQFKALVASGMDSTTAFNQAVSGARMPSMPAANVPSAVPTTIPRMPDVKESAQQANGASDGGAGRGVVVNIPDSVGQNVKNRNVAHVVTGGYGAI